MLTYKDKAGYYPLPVRHTRKEPETQLEKDIAAAKAAGMSYGQYKALNPSTVPTKPQKEEAEDEQDVLPIKKPRAEKKKIHTKTCPACGQEFTSSNKSSIYCSKSCSNRMRARRSREKDRTPKVFKKVCPICGVEFTTESNQRVYCNALCRYRANNNPARRYDRG